MKQFSAIALCLVLFFNSSSQLAYLLTYKLFQAKITQDFCVNKNKPDSCCKGSCHLSQIEKKSETNSNQPFSSSSFKFREVEWVIQYAVIKLNHNSFSKEAVTPSYVYTSPVYTGHITSIFHPPCLLG